MYTSAFCNCESSNRIWIAKAMKKGTHFPVQRHCIYFFYFFFFAFLLSLTLAHRHFISAYVLYEFDSISKWRLCIYAKMRYSHVAPYAHDFIVNPQCLESLRLNATTFHNLHYYYVFFSAITRDPVHAFNRHSVGVMVCERITSVNMPTIQRA